MSGCTGHAEQQTWESLTTACSHRRHGVLGVLRPLPEYQTSPARISQVNRRRSLYSPFTHFIHIESEAQSDAFFAATIFVFLSKQSLEERIKTGLMVNVRAAMSGWGAEESAEKDPGLADSASCPHQGEKENCGKDPWMKAACSRVITNTSRQKQLVFIPVRTLLSLLYIPGYLSKNTTDHMSIN